MIENMLSERIMFRADPGLKEQIIEYAENSKMSVSEFCRAILVNALGYDKTILKALTHEYHKSVNRVESLMHSIADNNAAYDVFSGRFDERVKEVNEELGMN